LLLVWAAAFLFLVLCSFYPLLFVSPIVCLWLGDHSLSRSPSLSLLHLYLFLKLKNYFTSPYKITFKLNLSWASCSHHWSCCHPSCHMIPEHGIAHAFHRIPCVVIPGFLCHMSATKLRVILMMHHPTT
jgi:hypothetical protein